jgi:hypothetical protein
MPRLARDAGPCSVSEALVAQPDARGEHDASFDWLDRAYAQRDSGLANLMTSPLLRSLHGDSRWGEFLKRMRFER